MARRSNRPETKIECPICFETICKCNDIALMRISTFAHLLGHVMKKEKDKHKAVRDAWKFAILVVDAQTGAIIDGRLIDQLEEYITKYYDS